MCKGIYPSPKCRNVVDEISDGSIASFIASRYTVAPAERSFVESTSNLINGYRGPFTSIKRQPSRRSVVRDKKEFSVNLRLEDTKDKVDSFASGRGR